MRNVRMRHIRMRQFLVPVFAILLVSICHIACCFLLLLPSVVCCFLLERAVFLDEEYGISRKKEWDIKKEGYGISRKKELQERRSCLHSFLLQLFSKGCTYVYMLFSKGYTYVYMLFSKGPSPLISLSGRPFREGVYIPILHVHVCTPVYGCICICM